MKAKPAEISIRRTEITIETLSVTRIRRATVAQSHEENDSDEERLSVTSRELTGEALEIKEL